MKTYFIREETEKAGYRQEETMKQGGTVQTMEYKWINKLNTGSDGKAGSFGRTGFMMMCCGLMQMCKMTIFSRVPGI